MVRSVVKLYRQRAMVTPQLAMPMRVEDAVVRVMTPGKVAEGTKDRAVRCCAQWGWEEGPFTVSMLLAKACSIASKLTDSCHEEWFNLAQQTAEGQCLATTLYCDKFDGNQERMKDGDWDEHCRACGLWSKKYDQV